MAIGEDHPFHGANPSAYLNRSKIQYQSMQKNKNKKCELFYSFKKQAWMKLPKKGRNDISPLLQTTAAYLLMVYYGPKFMANKKVISVAHDSD